MRLNEPRTMPVPRCDWTPEIEDLMQKATGVSKEPLDIFATLARSARSRPETGSSYEVKQILDLFFTVGQYVLVSMVLNSTGVQLEEGAEGFPR